MPTVSKRFPFLSEEKSYTIQELVDFAEGVDSKLKVFKNVVEKRDIIEKNYKMMQLYAPNISARSAQHIRSILKEQKLMFNKTGVQTMMMVDGFGAYDMADLFALFREWWWKVREDNELEFWDELSMLTKISSAFFILGKATGFMTFMMYFVDLVLAKWMLILYASFIGISILLSCIQMFSSSPRWSRFKHGLKNTTYWM